MPFFRVKDGINLLKWRLNIRFLRADIQSIKPGSFDDAVDLILSLLRQIDPYDDDLQRLDPDQLMDDAHCLDDFG